MRKFTAEEKLKSIPFMLVGDDLSYYATILKPCTTHKSSMDTFGDWYNLDDQNPGY